MVDFRPGDAVMYRKQHAYNGDDTLNGETGVIGTRDAMIGHVHVIWENEKMPCFPFAENLMHISDTPNPHGEARTEAKGGSGHSDDTQGLQARCEAIIRGLAEWHQQRDGNLIQATIDRLGKDARQIVRELDPIAALIDDLMAQDLPEREKLAKAYEAGRNTPA